MTHPLTDVFCEQHFGTLNEAEDLIFDFEDLRSAADWQLHQVIEWLDENLSNYDTDTEYSHRRFLANEQTTADLAKAMRPTKTQEDN